MGIGRKPIITIWRFSDMGVPHPSSIIFFPWNKHPFYFRIFHYKPSSYWGTSIFRKPWYDWENQHPAKPATVGYHPGARLLTHSHTAPGMACSQPCGTTRNASPGTTATSTGGWDVWSAEMVVSASKNGGFHGDWTIKRDFKGGTIGIQRF